MYLFVDASDPAIIRDLHKSEIVHGVTTNPTTVSKYLKEHGNGSIKTVRDLAYAIAGAVADSKKPFPISIEAVGCTLPYRPEDITAERLYDEAREVMDWNEHLKGTHVRFWQKIPTIPAGVRAMARLVNNLDFTEGSMERRLMLSVKFLPDPVLEDPAYHVKINATLGFDYKQGIRAAEAGAHVFSLFMGRMQSTGEDAVTVARRIISEYREREFRTGFLAASMRTPELILESWRAGADIATAPPEVIEELLKRYSVEFGEMRASHPGHGRRLVSRVEPVMYFSDEFKHQLLDPGLRKFVSDAAEAEYDILGEEQTVKI